MLPEKKVETSIKQYLDKIGTYYVKIHGSEYVPAGTPDILCCVKGRFVAIEVKKPKGGRVSALQKLKLKLIEEAGGVSIVAKDVSDVQERLKRERLV